VGPFVKELGKLRELRVLDCVFWGSVGQEHGIRFGGVSSQSPQDPTSETVKCGYGRARKGHLGRGGAPATSPMFEFTGLPSCVNPSNLPNLTRLDLDVTESEKHGRVARALPPQPETITVNDGFFFKLRFLVLYGSCLFSTKTRVFHLHSGIFFKDHVAAFGTRSTNRHA
jgi:hypothetical protein